MRRELAVLKEQQQQWEGGGRREGSSGRVRSEEIGPGLSGATTCLGEISGACTSVSRLDLGYVSPGRSGITTDRSVSDASARSETKRSESKFMFAPEVIAT